MLVTKLVTPPPDRHEQETAWTRRRFGIRILEGEGVDAALAAMREAPLPSSPPPPIAVPLPAPDDIRIEALIDA